MTEDGAGLATERDPWGREVARPDDILIALEELAALTDSERHGLLGSPHPGDWIMAGRTYFLDLRIPPGAAVKRAQLEVDLEGRARLDLIF